MGTGTRKKIKERRNFPWCLAFLSFGMSLLGSLTGVKGNSLHLYLMKKVQEGPQKYEKHEPRNGNSFCMRPNTTKVFLLQERYYLPRVIQNLFTGGQNALNPSSEAKNSDSSGSAKSVIVMELNRQNILS